MKRHTKNHKCLNEIKCIKYNSPSHINSSFYCAIISFCSIKLFNNENETGNGGAMLFLSIFSSPAAILNHQHSTAPILSHTRLHEVEFILLFTYSSFVSSFH